MKILLLFVIILQLLWSAKAQYGPKIKVALTLDISDPTPEVGDTVRVTCHVVNRPEEGYFLSWIKSDEDGDTNIGTNRFFESPYRDRYSATMDTNEEGDDITYVLTIWGVIPSDSGEIGCRVPNANLAAYKKIDVIGGSSSSSPAHRPEMGMLFAILVVKLMAN